MLVKCAQCGAAYDFPVEALPESGLRAKCASCGHVMVISPPPAEAQTAEPPSVGRASRRPGRALDAIEASGGDVARLASSPPVSAVPAEVPAEAGPVVAPRDADLDEPAPDPRFAADPDLGVAPKANPAAPPTPVAPTPAAGPAPESHHVEDTLTGVAPVEPGRVRAGGFAARPREHAEDARAALGVRLDEVGRPSDPRPDPTPASAVKQPAPAQSAPAQSAPSQPRAARPSAAPSANTPRRTGQARRGPRGPSVATVEVSTEATHRSETREERTADEGPNIIVDMGMLATGESSPIPTPVSSAVAVAGPAPQAPADILSAISRHADFAPLSTPAPELPSAEVPRPPPPVAILDNDDVDIRPIRPPAIGWALVWFLLLGLVGFSAFVWIRNDREPVWRDPGPAIKMAFGFLPRPVRTPLPSRAPSVVEAEVSGGALTVEDLELRYVAQGKTERAAVVSGVLVNGTPRAQRGIGIEAWIERDDGYPLLSRVFACCDAFGEPEAAEVARDPTHEHFSESLNRAAAVSLPPGARRPFTLILRDVPAEMAQESLSPGARIKFSEPERVATPPLE